MPTTVTTHAGDRLSEAVRSCCSPACVGLDPVVDRLPDVLTGSPLHRIEAFSLGIIDAVKGRVPAMKLQSACYEAYGGEGVTVLTHVAEVARSNGMIVILDAKRGDIGISARHYATAAFEAIGADWVTASPYLGMETLEPFLERGGGVFALVRTSNPGSDQLQALRLEDGRTVSQCVAEQVAVLGEQWLGNSGWSSLGAVTGATKVSDLAHLRAAMPHQFLLVPGYGAQGGRAEDVAACFVESGMGALITASRSVIYADDGGRSWQGSVERAATSMSVELAIIAGMGR
jgi:orotidine-5'-phosphate decarboxylase